MSCRQRADLLAPRRSPAARRAADDGGRDHRGGSPANSHRHVAQLRGAIFRAGAIVLVALAAMLPGMANGAPNIVVMIADDHGFGDLSCYGHPTLRTPNIDRIAREGARFDLALLTISSCSPSRCSFLTGRYPHNTRAEDLHAPLPSDQVTIAQYLQRAGYWTAAVGKWHLGQAERANWDQIVECPGAETGEKTLQVLRQRPPDQPLFLWMASTDPHRPYGQDGIEQIYSADDAVVPAYLPDHPLIRQEIAQYYDEIARFDRHVGQVLDELAAQGILDSTIVVYLSDNGMPFPRAKTTLYDSGIRTPLLIRYPPVFAPGSVQRQLVSTIDVTRTLIDLAGIDAPTLQGLSLLPLAKNPTQRVREAAYAEANWHDFEQFSRAVRTERYLLVRNYYWDKPIWNSVDSINSRTWTGLTQLHQQGKLTPAQRYVFVEPRPFEEFYDLQIDPQSLDNVIDDPRYRAEVNRLRTLLDNWRVTTQDQMPDQRQLDGWTRDGRPLPHNQPWYDRYIEAGGESSFERF